MRQLHDLDVRVMERVGHAVVKRQHAVDALDRLQDRHQRGLRPNKHFARQLAQRLGEANELDRVP